MKSLVWSKTSQKKLTLEKCLTQVHPLCKQVWGFVPFVAGSLPKSLAKQATGARSFDTKHGDGEQILRVIELCRSKASVSLLWIMKMEDAKGRLSPSGLALVTNKLMVLPGGGELALE